MNGRAAWRNDQAITLGQAKSGRVIAAAAGIMILVFGSFILDFDRPLQEFGFGLGFAVLVDALVIRNLLMPAIMHLVGPADWAMPSWLDRLLPNVSVEVDEDTIPLPASEEPAARARRRRDASRENLVDTENTDDEPTSEPPLARPGCAPPTPDGAQPAPRRTPPIRHNVRARHAGRRGRVTHRPARSEDRQGNALNTPRTARVAAALLACAAPLLVSATTFTPAQAASTDTPVGGCFRPALGYPLSTEGYPFTNTDVQFLLQTGQSLDNAIRADTLAAGDTFVPTLQASPGSRAARCTPWFRRTGPRDLRS